MNRPMSLLMAGLALVAVGSGSPSAAAEPAESAPGEISTDPLEGRWQATFTCQDVVDVLVSTGWGSEAPPILQQYSHLTTPPPADDLCAGAPDSFTRVVTFTGPRLAMLDPDGRVGFDTSVTIQDMPAAVGPASGAQPVDRNGLIIIPGDPGDPDYPFWYVIAGDTLTLRSIIRDPGWISAVEMADWLRVE